MVATALPSSDFNPTTCAPRAILLHRSRLLGATLQAMWAMRTTIVPRLTDELICKEVMLLDILYLFFRFLSSRNFATTTAFCLLHETSGIDSLQSTITVGTSNVPTKQFGVTNASRHERVTPRTRHATAGRHRHGINHVSNLTDARELVSCFQKRVLRWFGTTEKMSGLTCNTAPGMTFTTMEELKAHYKTDWHRYNLKRKVSAFRNVSSSTSFSSLTR
eukprot:3185476-Pyramimonas_sp.AAC.2